MTRNEGTGHLDVPRDLYHRHSPPEAESLNAVVMVGVLSPALLLIVLLCVKRRAELKRL